MLGAALTWTPRWRSLVKLDRDAFLCLGALAADASLMSRLEVAAKETKSRGPMAGSTAVARSILDGARATHAPPAVPHGRVALDVAVINALGQDHWDATFARALGAANAYSARKAAHLDTKERCRGEDINFEPMVFEAQGGVEPRAAHP